MDTNEHSLNNIITQQSKNLIMISEINDTLGKLNEKNIKDIRFYRVLTLILLVICVTLGWKLYKKN